MPTDDIDRLRKDYEKACVAVCEGSYSMPITPYGSTLHRAMLAAREALQAALARQQKDSEDEEMIAFMVPLLLRPSIATEREQDMIHKVRHLLSVLKDAGFSLRKDRT